jgi:tRNA(Ile)-lysidine synthase
MVTVPNLKYHVKADRKTQLKYSTEVTENTETQRKKKIAFLCVSVTSVFSVQICFCGSKFGSPMQPFLDAITKVPSGHWAVGVSGGGDSVALLMLLNERPDLHLHVVHLDHQTRGQASTGDAEFVRDLAAQLGIPAAIARREDIEPNVANPPANRSALFRAIRAELFRQVIREQNLMGVILGHHADDQAETVLHRLLRGSGPSGLAGISPSARVQGIQILRPLIGIHRKKLREYLESRGQPWREDASNQSDQYARNRIRHWLAEHPTAIDPLLELSNACRVYRDWIIANSPKLAETFQANILADLPRPLGRQSAKRWLIARGCPAGELVPTVLDRLREMAADAATRARQQFPGGIMVRRKSGKISA